MLTKSIVFVGGPLAGAFIVGIVFVSWTPARALSWATWHAKHLTLAGAPTSCGSTSWLADDPVESAAAYNELPSTNGITYYADNIRDGNLVTAWAQPDPDPNRESFITLQLAHRTHIRLLCLQRGYAKNYHAFATNERLHSISVSFPGARCRRVRVSLPDILKSTSVSLSSWASVPVSCNAQHVRITITRTWPATDHSHDVAVSEAQVYGG